MCSQQVYSKREEYHCKSIVISSCSFSLRAPVTYRYVRENHRKMSFRKNAQVLYRVALDFWCCLICMAREIMLNRGIAAILLFLSSQLEIPFQKHSYAVLSCIALLIMFLLLRGNCHFQRGKNNETQMFLVYCFLP